MLNACIDTFALDRKMWARKQLVWYRDDELKSYLQFASKFWKKGDRRSRLEVRIQILEENKKTMLFIVYYIYKSIVQE